MSTHETRVWNAARAVTLVTLVIFALCVVSQQLNGIPDLVSKLVFDVGGYVLAGFIISSLALFVLSLLGWRNLSRFQRALGLGIFTLNVLFFLVTPIMH